MNGLGPKSNGAKNTKLNFPFKGNGRGEKELLWMADGILFLVVENWKTCLHLLELGVTLL